MSPDSSQPGPTPSVEAYLLGTIEFADALALQQRLVYEAGGRQDAQITLLVCEHPDTITIGRAGSRAHLRLSDAELVSRQIDVQWVNRGGGVLLHTPGQLAVYPIVPLAEHGWTVGDYLARLQRGLLAVLADVGVRGETRQDTSGPRHGIWGRNGQLVAVGAAVKNWITYYGAFVNVAPALRLFRQLDCDLVDRTPMSSLARERNGHVAMSGVRASVVRRLADAFDCSRYHIYGGHPLIQSRSTRVPAMNRRAS